MGGWPVVPMKGTSAWEWEKRSRFDNPFDFTTAFGESGLSSMFELFGTTPSARVEAFRRQQPVAGFLSEVTGMLVPYGGWLKAITKIPKAMKLLSAVGKTTKSPVVQGILRESLRMAPFEMARASSRVALGERPEHALADFGVSMLLEGAAGGVGGVVKAFGKRRKTAEELLGSVNMAGGVQPVLRNLKTELGKALSADVVDDGLVAVLRDKERKLERFIRTEIPAPVKFEGMGSMGSGGGAKKSASGMYLDELESLKLHRAAGAAEGLELSADVTDSISAMKQMTLPGTELKSVVVKPVTAVQKARAELESLFFTQEQVTGKLAKNQGFSSHRLIDTGRDAYPGWEDTLKQIGIVRDDIASMQTPRIIKAAEVRGRVFKKVVGNTLSGGDDIFYSRETGDGLYAMFIRFMKKDKEHWVTFKTDAPEQFMKEQAMWHERSVKFGAWARTPGRRPNGAVMPAYDEIAESLYTTKLVDDLAVLNAPTKEGALKGLIRKYGIDPIRDLGVVQRLGQAIEKVFVPRMHQLKGRTLGRKLLMVTREAFDEAGHRGLKHYYGDFRLDDSMGPFKATFTGKLKAVEGSIDDLAKKLTDDEWDEFSSFINRSQFSAGSLDKAADLMRKGEFSPAVFNLLKKSNAGDEFINKVAGDTAATVGVAGFKPRKHHYMVSRVWEGDHRVFIQDESGVIRETVGGLSQLDAIEMGKQTVKRIEETAGKKFTASKPFLKGDAVDEVGERTWLEGASTNHPNEEIAREAVQSVLYESPRPGVFKRRSGVKGYVEKYDYESYKKQVVEHIQARERYNTSLALRAHIEPQLQLLRLFEDDHAVDIVLKRLGHEEGKYGKIVQAQVEAGNKYLAPVLGKNGAMKIANATKETFMRLTLNVGNLGYSSVSLMTYMHTVLPELAMITKNAPRRIGKHTSWMPVCGANGRPKKAVGFLNSLKMCGEAAGRMIKPDDMLQRHYARAITDGTIDTFMGTGIGRFKHSGDATFLDGFFKVVDFSAVAPERLSRMHAVALGDMVGQDILGIVDEGELYRYVKEFSDNCMFRYAAADKAAAFTGPIGSTFGLFKNWATHYIGQVMKYAGEMGRGNFAPFLYMMGGVGMLGGIKAWPMASAAEAFSKFATDKPLMEHVYQSLYLEDMPEGKEDILSDAIYYGLPTLLGLSITNQAQAPFNTPVRDVSMLMNFVQYDRAKALGKAVGEAGDYMDAMGEWNPMKSERIRGLFARAVAPKTVYRALESFSGPGIRSVSSGYPIVNDAGIAEKLMYTFGFTPTKIQRMYEVSRDLWEDQDKRRTRTSVLGKAWAEAEDNGDHDTLFEVQRSIFDHGLDYDAVLRSAKAIQARADSDMLERRFSYERIAARRYSIGY